MIQLKTILTKLIEQCGFVMSKKGGPVRFASVRVPSNKWRKTMDIR